MITNSMWSSLFNERILRPPGPSNVKVSFSYSLKKILCLCRANNDMPSTIVITI